MPKILRRRTTPFRTASHTPAPLDVDPSGGNAAEADALRERMRAQRAGRDVAPSYTPFLDRATEELTATGPDQAAAALGCANLAATGVTLGARFEDDEAPGYELADPWDRDSNDALVGNLGRFVAGPVGLGLTGIGVAKGGKQLGQGALNRRKAKTRAGKMLANREIKDAALNTTSSVLGFGSGAAALAAGAIPGADTHKLVFDAGRQVVEGSVAANEARRLHRRDLTRARRNEDLGDVTPEAFLEARDQWRAGTLDDATFAQQYGSIADSYRADEIRQHLARHKRRRAGDQFFQAGANVVDTAGGFTGAVDFGVTKATAKTAKLGRTGLRAGRAAAIRAQRVHKLRKAKNQVEGCGDVDPGGRGVVWGAKQYLVGNVDRQRAKLDAQANAGQFDTVLDTAGMHDAFRELTVKRDERDTRDLHEMVTRTAGDEHSLGVRDDARKTALAAGVMSRGAYRKLEGEAERAADAAVDALRARAADARAAFDDARDQGHPGGPVMAERLRSEANEAEEALAKAREDAKQQYLNEQLWDAKDDRVGQKGANVGKLLIGRQFNH